jgi:hypothetical protein
VKLLTLKPGEKLQDISLVIPDGEDSESTGSINIEASEAQEADIDTDAEPQDE